MRAPLDPTGPAPSSLSFHLCSHRRAPASPQTGHLTHGVQPHLPSPLTLPPTPRRANGFLRQSGRGHGHSGGQGLQGQKGDPQRTSPWQPNTLAAWGACQEGNFTRPQKRPHAAPQSCSGGRAPRKQLRRGREGRSTGPQPATGDPRPETSSITFTEETGNRKTLTHIHAHTHAHQPETQDVQGSSRLGAVDCASPTLGCQP